MENMPALTLNLLGPLTALLDDQSVYEFRTAKVQALLVYLAMEKDRPHRREVLMDFLWPDTLLESAQVNLRQTIYRLRQTIPEVNSKSGNGQVPLILAERLTLQLNPAADVRLDVDDFQACLETDPARAAALYRGNFLSDFYLVDSSAFEEWAETLREKLRRQLLQKLDETTQHALEQGDYEDAQTFAWKQLEVDRLRESAYRQLMMALASNGQRNTALAQYQLCQQRLREELGVSPSEETQQLHQQILTNAYPAKLPKRAKMRALPQGMPVFMLTDIEGSTQLWDTYHKTMLAALMRHNAILEEQIPAHGGRILELRGDGVKAVFETGDPLACVLAIQKAFERTDWGEIGTLKIRIGLHGVPTVKKGIDYFKEEDRYYGPVLNHTSRIMDAGWGGQILVSDEIQQTFSLPTGARWVDFGPQNLRSIAHPVHIYGLLHPDLHNQSFPPLRTLSTPPLPEPEQPARPRHTLPSQPTAFVGRREELATLEEMLVGQGVRQVTVVGPGGMGKTRLALAVGEKLVDYHPAEDGYCFPDGVFFISLVSISSPEQIIPLIGKTLGIPLEVSQNTESMERASQSVTTQKEKLIGYLAERSMLLILDNFEHLIEGAEIVSDILQAAPNLHVLVTSRERLRIREEQVFPIQGLDFPDWEAPDSPGAYTSMELFLQSARRVQPDFTVTEADMVSLTRICRLVGGMPLGLELAASWVDMLSLNEIVLEIQKCLDFLETDLRNIPDRHRSIRAVFDSSWNLLSEGEQQFFARLSIFRGTFSRHAAEKITHAKLQNLATLVSKSLLQYDREKNRYQVHELLRQYGAEQLAENPQDEFDAYNCFSDFFSGESEKHLQLFMDGQMQPAIERLEMDHNNIRFACDWAIEHQELTHLNRAINGICFYYDWSWRADEGVALCKNGLDMLRQTLPGDGILYKRLQANLLSWMGYFNLFFQHDLASRMLEQAIAIVHELEALGVDARVEKGLILFYQGILNLLSGSSSVAKTLIEQSLAISTEIAYPWMIIRNMMALGDIASSSGLPSEAKHWYSKALIAAKKYENVWGEINSLNSLGWAARRLISYQEAQAYLDESITLAKISNHPWEVIRGLESSGFLLLYLGQFEQAYARFAEAIAISIELGLPYQTLPTQSHMGISKWMAGNFEQAEEELQKALALSQTLNPSARIFTVVCWLEFLILAGRYPEAHAQVRLLNTIKQGIFIERFIDGRIHRVLGWLALAEGKLAEARNHFETSIELYQMITDDEQVAWSQATLAVVAVLDGNFEEAYKTLVDILWASIETRGFIPLLFTFPALCLYLAQTDPEQAQSVYQPLQSTPLLVNAPFFRDAVYRHLPETITPLSPSPAPETDPGQALWTAATQVLTSWLQVWREDSVLQEAL
ncbi:MAG: AAA family ATPase [Anaerolineales bacterium]|nr:AAA family ATPase [Anaerolineales bacterium]